MPQDEFDNLVFAPTAPDSDKPLAMRLQDVEAEEEWLTLDEMIKRYILRVLEHTKGNKQAAARILEIDRTTLYRILKRHNLEK